MNFCRNIEIFLWISMKFRQFLFDMKIYGFLWWKNRVTKKINLTRVHHKTSRKFLFKKCLVLTLEILNFSWNALELCQESNLIRITGLFWHFKDKFMVFSKIDALIRNGLYKSVDDSRLWGDFFKEINIKTMSNVFTPKIGHFLKTCHTVYRLEHLKNSRFGSVSNFGDQQRFQKIKISFSLLI